MSGEAPRATPAQIASAVFGIALEVYDFTTYSYFAIAIAHSFFPSSSPLVGLMLSLGTFGAGFLSRPFGALIIGSYADRIGRKPAMVLSFSLMGVGILAIACTPSYESIGAIAPCIVLLARIIQGFALGGEVGTTTAFLLEAAPARHRGFYCALQYGGQGLAAVLAGLVGFALSSLLDNAALESFGWRIAMLLGAIVLPIGLYIRRNMPETLHQADPSPVEAPPKLTDPAFRRIFLLGLLMISSGAVGGQTTHYMTTYAIVVLHLPTSVGLALPAITGFFVMTCGVISGALSDRFGRRPVMLYPAALSLALTYPVYYSIVHQPSAGMLLGGMALWSFVGSFSAGASITAVTEALPRSIRSTSFSLLYAGAQAIFGGTTQFAITWLIYATDDKLAPVWFALLAGAVGLGVRMMLHETAPCRVRS